MGIVAARRDVASIESAVALADRALRKKAGWKRGRSRDRGRAADRRARTAQGRPRPGRRARRVGKHAEILVRAIRRSFVGLADRSSDDPGPPGPRGRSRSRRHSRAARSRAQPGARFECRRGARSDLKPRSTRRILRAPGPLGTEEPECRRIHGAAGRRAPGPRRDVGALVRNDRRQRVSRRVGRTVLFRPDRQPDRPRQPGDRKVGPLAGHARRFR